MPGYAAPDMKVPSVPIDGNIYIKVPEGAAGSVI